MPTPSGALERSLAAITVGAVRATRAKEKMTADLATAERDVQYQIAVSGTANTGIGFSTVDIVFDVNFHYAPGQRDSDLRYPQMTFGAEADAQVALTAVVSSWDVDDGTGAVKGATVVVGAISDDERLYNGKIHITFQGYASVQEPVSR